MAKFLQPQEIEVWYVLPAIRREIVSMLKGSGLSQKEVASKMGLTEAAVSQYMHSKRAGKITFSDVQKTHIKEAAENIKKNSNPVIEIQRLMNVVWSQRVVCGVCVSHNSLSHTCSVCFDTGLHQRGGLVQLGR